MNNPDFFQNPSHFWHFSNNSCRMLTKNHKSRSEGWTHYCFLINLWLYFTLNMPVEKRLSESILPEINGYSPSSSVSQNQVHQSKPTKRLPPLWSSWSLFLSEQRPLGIWNQECSWWGGGAGGGGWRVCVCLSQETQLSQDRDLIQTVDSPGWA